MDFLSIAVLAGAMICFIAVAAYMRTSGTRIGGDSDDMDIDKAFPEGSGEREDMPGKKAAGSVLLFIPPEMMDDKRNEDIRNQVEETVREFRWGADGGKSSMIYALKQENPGWKCPYCEGENNEEVPICIICGRERPQPPETDQ